MQEKVVKTYRPTVQLQTLLVVSDFYSELVGRNKYYVEMNAVPCNTFSIL